MKTTNKTENFLNLLKKIIESIGLCNVYELNSITEKEIIKKSKKVLNNFLEILTYGEKNNKEFSTKENLIKILEKIKKQSYMYKKDIFLFHSIENKEFIKKETNLNKLSIFNLKQIIYFLLENGLFEFKNTIKNIIINYKIELKNLNLKKEVKKIGLKLLNILFTYKQKNKEI